MIMSELIPVYSNIESIHRSIQNDLSIFQKSIDELSIFYHKKKRDRSDIHREIGDIHQRLKGLEAL
jgi:hypothetical protein